jgi:hypothetical protein
VNEANALLSDADSVQADALRGCVERLNFAWQSLRALCAARREALANAKQIHAFTKQADELLELLEEKELCNFLDLESEMRVLQCMYYP